MATFVSKKYAMAMLTFHVDNLKCGGCASSIRKRIGEFPGVNNVLVDPDVGTVQVAQDGTTNREEVSAALGSLGYPDQGTGGFTEKAKSHLSCAIGRF